MTPFSFSRFALLFLKAGNLTFGGGDPTMAVLQRELVELRGWVSPERYGLVYGLARVTPGTNLLALCAGMGWDLARWLGALAGVCAVGGPGAVVVVWFTLAYETWKSNPWAMAAIGGTLAAAIGMMAGGALQLVRPQWKAGRRVRALVIAGSALALAAGFSLTPIQVLALGAMAGVIWRPE